MNRRLGKIEFSFSEVRKGRITESRQWQMRYMEQDSLARSPAKLNQTNRLLALSLSCLHAFLSLRSAYGVTFLQPITYRQQHICIRLVCKLRFLLNECALKVKRWLWDVFPGAVWCFKELCYSWQKCCNNSLINTQICKPRIICLILGLYFFNWANNKRPCGVFIFFCVSGKHWPTGLGSVFCICCRWRSSHFTAPGGDGLHIWPQHHLIGSFQSSVMDSYRTWPHFIRRRPTQPGKSTYIIFILRSSFGRPAAPGLSMMLSIVADLETVQATSAGEHWGQGILGWKKVTRLTDIVAADKRSETLWVGLGWREENNIKVQKWVVKFCSILSLSFICFNDNI